MFLSYFFDRNALVDAEIAPFTKPQIVTIGEGFDFNKVYVVCPTNWTEQIFAFFFIVLRFGG